MTTIQMPQLGETIVEGTILKWLKREGEEIERDEPLFEISTDKVDTEVPSPVSGTVSKILVEEGQTVPVGTDLAEVSEDGQATGAGAAAPATEAPAQEPAAPSATQPATAESAQAVAEGSAAEMPAAEPATPQGEAASTPNEPAVPAAVPPAAAAPASESGALPDRGPRSRILSPLVRRLADEHGLDLSTIEGTGTGGRITKKDVMAVIESGGAAAAAATAPAPATAEVPPAAAAPAPVPAAPVAPAPATAPAAAPAPVAQTVPPGAGEEIVPVDHIRKTIGQHMVASVQTSARAWTMVEVNVDHLVKLRDRAKEAFKEKYGVSLTYLPFVIRAACDALLTHPEVNSQLRGEEIVLHRFVNMGIAVSYDKGLIVPVIKGADAMNTVGLARSIADLAARARAHQLKPDEVQGSTFTITNPGPYGSVVSVPIINQPNTGILSLDAITKRAVVIEDTIAIRSMVNISMSWDHRTIDGEIATRFLARVKQNLESWDFAEDVAI
jgi:pyruvate/2-oxoglutarate dehydrogenase complex dihydrolipoamide acyltransferase (E2) component